MTTVTAYDPIGMEHHIREEVYRLTRPVGKEIPSVVVHSADSNKSHKSNHLKSWSPSEIIEAVEDRMTKELIEQNYQILSVKSEFITKRRYKRKLAKQLKRLGKQIDHSEGG